MTSPRDLERVFHEELIADAAVERRLLVKELLVVVIIVLLIAAREWLL